MQSRIKFDVAVTVARAVVVVCAPPRHQRQHQRNSILAAKHLLTMMTKTLVQMLIVLETN